MRLMREMDQWEASAGPADQGQGRGVTQLWGAGAGSGREVRGVGEDLDTTSDISGLQIMCGHSHPHQNIGKLLLLLLLLNILLYNFNILMHGNKDKQLQTPYAISHVNSNV